MKLCNILTFVEPNTISDGATNRLSNCKLDHSLDKSVCNGEVAQQNFVKHEETVGDKNDFKFKRNLNHLAAKSKMFELYKFQVNVLLDLHGMEIIYF